MAFEFALETAVDLSGSRETGADNLAWFIEHTSQTGLIVAEAAALVAVMYGLVMGLRKIGGAIAPKKAAVAA